jgi:small subunit ribosomal protein S5
MDGLTGLRRPEDVAKLRGLSIKQVLGLDLKEAAAKAAANGNGAPAADAVADAPAPEAAAGESPEEPAEAADVPGGEEVDSDPDAPAEAEDVAGGGSRG